MTWQPRIIEGGATPQAEPPLVWWHVDAGQTEAVMAQWPVVPGFSMTVEGTLVRRALFHVGDAGPVFVRGHRPDEITFRELAEDVERWHAAQADDGDHLESARWGARYHA